MALDLVRLEDLRIEGLNLSVACTACGHQAILDGPKLWRWFAVHRWDGAVARIGEHLRCSICGDHPTVFSTTFDAPTMSFGPTDEAGWQRLVSRLR